MKIRNPRVLALPYPAQGHVFPLMELCLCLLKHGFTITFVNNEFIHERLMSECKEKGDLGDQLRLVSLPDWLDPAKDKNKPRKTTEASEQLMQQKLEEPIAETNGGGCIENITCVITDNHKGWALEVAAKMGIRRVAFCAIAATVFAWQITVPNLIGDGIISNDLSPKAPAMNTRNFAWARLGNLSMQKSAFQFFFSLDSEATEVADLLICNSSYELEPAAFDLAPGIIPVGPLLSNWLGNSVGHLWKEDSTFMYAAFGSFTSFDQTRFQELVLGLELSNMPFLWVVRPNTVECKKEAYPPGFQDRGRTRGKIVHWAPQQKVLAHPSVACLLSHCGWNSAVEGVNSGLPFLCWPYFADQFLNESYICDEWKVGLRLSLMKAGSLRDMKLKLRWRQLVGDPRLRERALNLKEVALNSVREGGSSYNNLQHLAERLKA
ncbi:hypothetical protein PVL29_018916 [Vitis rotundifolia]|uniref:UDP-glycosyltransferase 83A1 n=1 Tax=Vitis rotundifolia TaxID=103349 RepID=A0AA38Z648_VITRO|nr:hypothetical protein PVL29_018916 [Vitis rotundifolia]